MLQGNIKFGAGDNRAALKLYTESVICAPVGPALGLALGNRSAALYHLGQYEEASRDIELALENKFPRNIEYKLHLRQAQCYIRLGQYHNVEAQLERSRTGLEHAKLPENRKLAVMKDISALSNEIIRLKQSHTSPSSESVAEPRLAYSEEMAGASNKLKLQTSSDKTRGRFVTARENLEAGEVLFLEKPYSCVLLPPFYSSHCHHCLAPLAPVCVQRGQGGDLRRLRRGPVLCCLPAAAPPGQEAGRGAVPVCADSWSRPSSRTPPSFLLREKCRGSPPPPHRPARLQRARRHRAAGGRGRERGAGAPRHRHLPGRQPHEPQLRPAHRQQLPRQAADGAGPGTL